jgi:aerobic-type carbon monoxide dehydrogenase small subunit (CoxS/CutS family)
MVDYSSRLICVINRPAMARVSELHLNGKSCRVDADGERTLLSVLRDDLDLTGCKYGCGEGECGACTVLIDGKPTRSCTKAVGEVGGGKVVTIEGLERDGRLHPLQEAFLKIQALQCGYCTCGMIMSGVALLEKTPRPSDQEIVRAMNGNICRCGVYQRIVEAIKDAANAMPGKSR